MNVLDMRTLVFSQLVTDILCVWLVALLWRQNRNRFQGTAFWMADFILQSVALFLVAMRGVVPDWISMVLANALFVVGAILGYVGLERFFGKKGPQVHNYLLVTLFVVVHGYFTFIQPSLGVRNLNLAVALLLVCFQTFWLAWRRVEPSLRSLSFGVGAVNLLYCLLSLVRIANFFLSPQGDNDYFKPDRFEALVLVSYQVLLILLTYSFVLMVNRRLLMQIGTEEEKFAKAFYSAPHAITLTRRCDGTIIDVNNTFSLITGYDRAEVLGKRTLDLPVWEHHVDRATFVSALSETGSVRGMEMLFRKKSGETIVGLISAEELTIDGEKDILSSVEDITESKRAEQRLQDLLRLSPGVIYACKASGDFGATFVSTGVEKITGYGAQRFIDEPSFWLSHVHPDDRDPMLKELKKLVDCGEQALEYRFLHADGTYRWMYDNLFLVRDAKGGPVEIIGMWMDITGRKHTEQRLHRLSQAVEQSPAATVITDTNGRFEFVNPKFLQVTGYTWDELIGKTPAVIKSGRTPVKVYEDLWRTITSGKEWRGEIQNRRKNGEYYWEDEIISPLKDERGAIVNFIAVKEDITERKRAEEALQLKRALLLETERELVSARESLADADRLESVGRLAAGVAHEVKNPLMIVSLGVDYLSQQLSPGSDQRVLDDIRGAIDRANSVVGDLLDFSKQREFSRRPIHVNQVIDKAVHLTRHESKRRNIVMAESRCDPLPRIYADPDRLVQVFINLLSNAMQAIGTHGRIDIVAGTKRASARDLERAERNVFRVGEPLVTIEILDDGPGFPAEHEKKLFEPFFSTKPVGEGSGLGLAVSRNIVIMHKGSINLFNRTEGGVSALLMFRVAREHLTNE